MSIADDGPLQETSFDEEYQTMLQDLNKNVTAVRTESINKVLKELVDCVSCCGRWRPSYKTIDRKRCYLVQQEAKFGFGSDPDTVAVLDALWTTFCVDLEAHLASIQPNGPCAKHKLATLLIQELHEQCASFRTSLLGCAESMTQAIEYGHQLEADGDYEEVAHLVRQLGVKLELAVEMMLIPGCSFAPLP